MINNKNNLNLRKLIFFNFFSIIFFSFPIYAPLLIIGNGINISLKYQKYFKSAQELPNISAIDQLQIYFARILYHKAPYRNILQTNKDCFWPDKEFIYRPIPFSKCIQSNLEFNNLINFGEYGNRTDKYFKNNNKIDLITIGDSHGMGWGVDNESVFTSYLNKDGVNSINLSVPSYGTNRQVKLLKKWAFENPEKYRNLKYIVIQYCLNDLNENIYAFSNKENTPNFIKENYDFELLFKDNPYHLKFGSDWRSISNEWKIASRTLNVFYSYFPKKILNLKTFSNFISAKNKVFQRNFPEKLEDNLHISYLIKILEEDKQLLKDKKIFIFIANPYGYHVKRQSEIFQNYLENYESKFLKIHYLPSSLTTLDSYKSYYLLDDHISRFGHKKIYSAIKNNLTDF